MQSGTQEHVLATYREIAVRFGLSGPNAARLKTKRLGWRPSKPNRAGEVFRIRVPRELWEQQPEGTRAGPPRPSRRARRPGRARHLDDGGEMRAIQKLIDTLEKQRERNRSRDGTPDTQSPELISKLDAARMKLTDLRLGEARQRTQLAARQAEAERRSRSPGLPIAGLFRYLRFLWRRLRGSRVVRIAT